MGSLTQAHVRAALKKPGKYHDGSGLILDVAPSGSASWLARIQHHGQRREIGFCSLKAVSLAQAREKALRTKAALTAGRDPIRELAPPRELAKTFAQAARDFLQATADEKKASEKKRKQQLSWLTSYAFSVLGRLQVQSIDADAIADCLRPIRTKKPETARKVRSLIIGTLSSRVPMALSSSALWDLPWRIVFPRSPPAQTSMPSPYPQLPALMKRFERQTRDEGAARSGNDPHSRPIRRGTRCHLEGSGSSRRSMDHSCRAHAQRQRKKPPARSQGSTLGRRAGGVPQGSCAAPLGQ